MSKIAKHGNVTLDWLLTGEDTGRGSDISMVREDQSHYMPTTQVIISPDEKLKDRIKELEFKEHYTPIPIISHVILL